MSDTLTNSPISQMVRVREATEGDAGAIAEIYNQGIEDRVATYDTTLRTAEDRRTWLRSIAGRYPAVVAEVEGEVVGWAGAGPYRARECYRGVGEFSVYVRRDWRKRHIGDVLLPALIAEAERLGLWKLLSRIFLFKGQPGSLSEAWVPRSRHLRKARQAGWPMARRGHRRALAAGEPDLITVGKPSCT